MNKPMIARFLIGMVLVLWAGGGVAYAHAELRTSSPAVGEVFRWSPPTEVRLSFTQDVAASESKITLMNNQFTTLPLGAMAQEPDDPATIHAHLPALEDGTYTVNWESKSVDGHAMQGAYEFSIARRTPLALAVGAPVLLLVAGLGVWQWRRRSPAAGG